MRIIALYILLLCTASVTAQVTVDIKIDSLQLLVGEQTGVTLEVTCDANQRVVFPALKQGQELVPDVEIIAIKNDTAKLNEGNRVQYAQTYTIAAWDSSLYYLPPMCVQVDGKPHESKSLALKVYTVDVDTLHTDRYFGPKDEMRAPFSWDDWKLIIWLSIVIVVLTAVAILLWLSLKRGFSIMSVVRRKKKLPAHEVALGEIEKIKTERSWAQEDSKEYYTRLTDTLRTYIQERYKFNAMEMTSAEIIERLTEEDDQQALNELSELFRTADLVKFAKWSTMINENDANLMTALDYINQTKQEVDPDAAIEEQKERAERKRKRATIITMRGSIIGICLVIAAIACWIVYRVIDLLT